ncbi:tetratricopeptide repeat protein [Spirochaetia bacterium 38H-sp]|uniref:Tetratricopeptide repeat protein n=1 Tax=Rarispira pelagica TaxID=3141764 RepID=A0ABU9UDR3_9SPIR
MRLNKLVIIISISILSLIFFFVPSPPWVSVYLGGTNNIEKKTLRELYQLIETSSPDVSFIAAKKIATYLAETKQWEKRAGFLSYMVSRAPQENISAYYIFLLAEQYRQNNKTNLAINYYKRIVNTYPDLVLKGQHLHLESLKEIVERLDDPWERIKYYNLLIQKFPSQIDTGVAYYFLAEAYKDAGMWDEALKTYKIFLNYPDSNIPGEPNAYLKVSELLDFHNSSKNWLFEDLESLVDAIKYAIYTRNSALLARYRAKVNFFSISWEQEKTAKNAQIIFDFRAFFSGGRVRFSDNIDKSSNAKEAYLKTWGWSYRINTWYLYFRKVDYPFDPEIDGKWEWAGIYFGEKL